MEEQAVLAMVRQHGYRLTPQRRAILSALCRSASPVSAGEVYEEIKDRLGGMSVDTVYRNLNQMAEAGIVVAIHAGREVLRFELQVGDHHHHFVCLACHRIFCIPLCPFETPVSVSVDGHAFKVTGHSLEVYGYCSQCEPGEEATTSDRI